MNAVRERRRNPLGSRSMILPPTRLHTARRPRVLAAPYAAWPLIPVLLTVLVFAPSVAPAATTIYADNTLPSDCVGAYVPATRLCVAGAAVAYQTLRAATAAARAGDTVLLRRGTFREVLTPASSGSPDQYITFKNYQAETVTLTGTAGPALSLMNVSYVIVQGLRVTNVIGWGRLENSTHNIIRDSHFSAATAHGTTGGLKLVRSRYNRILDNIFVDGNDSVVVQESDRNLIQGNTFTKARHSLLSVRCGNFNVIRKNRFENPDQKAAEIYDCEGVSDAPYRLDATKRNIFEENEFAGTRASTRNYRYNAIQYSGQDGIVRRNLFYDNQGGALNFQVYSNEALYNNGHRVYHNTFYNNRCFAVSASGDTTTARYFDSIVTNNILHANVGCAGENIQTSIENPAAVRMRENAILITSPMFVDEGGRDFHLSPTSPMIDAGAFLTRAVGAGSVSTVMTVEDIRYFFDGYKIPGERGDAVQLEGQTDTARILGIDYGTNRLTLDRPLSWRPGQNLHLSYGGTRPDLGAYETGAGMDTAPRAPSKRRVPP